MITLDREALERLTPGAQVLYRQTFEYAEGLRDFGVFERALRLEHFLAQVLHETGGLRMLVENLNYSPQRMVEVWPSRFNTWVDALPFAHNSRALANKVYGGRMGNVGPNDGWRYIGRGLVQLTGRENYARIGTALGIDLVGYPSSVLDPENGLRVAGAYWASAGCNGSADADSLESVTKKINGGLVGLTERRAWLKRVRDARVVL